MSPSKYRTEIIHHNLLPTTPDPPLKTERANPKKYFKVLFALIICIFVLFSLGFMSLQIKKASLNCLERYLLLNKKPNLQIICSHRVINDLSLVQSSGSDLLNTIFSSGRFSRESLNSLQTTLKKLAESTSDLDGELQLTPQSSLTRTQINISRKISPVRQTAKQLVQLSPELTRLLAVDSRTSYLILIQDSTELRSSGGLIDTLAYFTLTNTHLEPPRYYSPSSLSAASPSSQSDPNFPASAKEISNLFTRSTSLPVDYVIALNLSTLEKILDYTGPVSLPDISSPVSSQNLVSSYLSLLSQTGSRNLFFQSLIDTLSTRISGLPVDSQIKVIYFFLSQLQARQIFISPVSVSWDGSLSPPPCPFGSCLSDFIIPVENHIGQNKSSAYVIRSVYVSHNISADLLKSQYRITLSNKSFSSVWPAGNVKNSFQLYLPLSVSIDSVQLENKTLSSGDYSLDSLPGFFRFSLLYNIPPSQTRRLLINYHQPFSEAFSHYRFTYLPQPGLLNYSFTQEFYYPEGWSVTTHQVPAVAQPGRVQYNSRTPNPYFLDLDIKQ